MYKRRKSSFAQLVSPLPHKTLTVNSPTMQRRRSRDAAASETTTSYSLRRTNSGSDDELASTLRTSLKGNQNSGVTDGSMAKIEREPTMTFFESDEENEDDESASRDRQLYLEAEEDFRELMGGGLAYNVVYSSRQNSQEATEPPFDMRQSYGLAGGDSSEEEFFDLELTFPRLGFSPEPRPLTPSLVDHRQETVAWEPPPYRASNPITKNEIFGWNGVVADVEALKTSKVLLPPHHEYFVDEDEFNDDLWSRRQAASATFTPPRRRTRIKSEPNCRFWHQPDDGVQCF